MSQIPIISKVEAGVIWSTAWFVPGFSLSQVSMRIFGTPRGAIGQGKPTPLDIVDTNLKEGFRVPGGFESERVAWEVIHSDEAYARSVAANGSWAWDLTQTLIDGSPLSYVPLLDGGSKFEFSKLTPVPADQGSVLAWGEIATPGMKLSGHSYTSIMLAFGNEALPVPKYGGPLRVRVAIMGRWANAIEIA